MLLLIIFSLNMIHINADDTHQDTDFYTSIDTLNTILHENIISDPSGAPTFGLMMFQMIAILIVLSVILYFFLYVVKRINGKMKNNNKKLSFKLIDNFYLSQKQGLSAVLFNNKLYIIGFSTNSISKIDIIEDLEVISQLNVDNTITKKMPEVFKNFFNRKSDL